jgi:hypothetical protein
MYLKTQPPDTRKKGFGSSDAKRRDEFSNDIEVRLPQCTARACELDGLRPTCLGKRAR